MTTDVRHQMIAMLPRLRRFARALTRSREDADDLVQAACERALRAIDRWEPGSRLDSWMFRILRNLWIDQLRRGRHETVADVADAGIDVAGEDGRRVAEGSRNSLKPARRLPHCPGSSAMSSFSSASRI